jgi:hypothetical protein
VATTWSSVSPRCADSLPSRALRDHADHLPAGREHLVGDRPHEAAARSPVDEGHAALGQAASEGANLFFDCGLPGRAAAAVDADALQVHEAILPSRPGESAARRIQGDALAAERTLLGRPRGNRQGEKRAGGDGKGLGGYSPIHDRPGTHDARAARLGGGDRFARGLSRREHVFDDDRRLPGLELEAPA